MKADPAVRRLPPLPCLCANLRRASRAVTQVYEDALRDSGLRITQLTPLQVLQRAGAMTQGQLGEALALDSTTLTRSLRPLLEMDLIASTPGRDRRERHLELTPRGRRRLEEIEPAWEQAQQQVRTSLKGGAWDSLMTELHALAANAGA